MGMTGLLHIGKSGLSAARAGVSTSGHNIANANTEGYSRQRIQQNATATDGTDRGRVTLGTGTEVSRVERINNDYIEKQIRSSGRDLAYSEEREVLLRQTEDIFNEMNGDGLNRVMARFFNDFRQLSNEPENLALREAIRESAQSMINDFKRMKSQLDDVRSHIDSRIEGNVRELNQLASEIAELNVKVRQVEIAGGSPNDLLDKRDLALKKLGAIVDVGSYIDKGNEMIVDIRGLGPFVTGGAAEKLSTLRTPAEADGKRGNTVDIYSGGDGGHPVTSRVVTGKLGALLKTRDATLATLEEKMNTIAFELARSVNEVHRMGFSREGGTQIDFFRPIDSISSAAEQLVLSDAVQLNSGNIAAAGQPDAPGDNRVALAIAGLQSVALMEGGRATFDDFYNSIVGEVGVAASRNRAEVNQNKDIMTQLSKMRDQISGVSVDEETTQLMQYQHAFDASARVIRVADELMKTVLSLKD